MKGLTWINDRLERVASLCASGMFAAFVVLVLIQVVVRNFPMGFSVLWATDAALLCFTWTIFLGAAIAQRHGVHYFIEVVPEHWRRTGAVVAAIAAILVLGGCAVLAVAGWEFLPSALRRRALSLGTSQVWFFAAIPVSATLMVAFQLENVVNALRAPASLWEKDEVRP